MIFRLISDSNKYLSFYFDEEQIERLVGERNEENYDDHINFNNIPRSYPSFYTEPLNFNFTPMGNEEKSFLIPDLKVSSGRLFLSERAYAILYPIIKNDGEFLPVKYQEGDGYFFTPLAVANVDSKVTLKNEWGDIESLGFNEKDTEKYAVFRTDYDGYLGLFCQEQVKQAIEDNNLTGLYITTDLANIFPEDRASVEKAN